TDVRTFQPQALLVAFPGLAAGSISAQASSDSFWEGHLDLAVKLLDDGGPLRINTFFGYRYYRYNESLHVQHTILPVIVTGSQFVASDNFTPRNHFNGLDVGLRPQVVWQALSLELLARVSVGNLHRTVDIAGSQVVTIPGTAPVTQTGGVFALPSNI